MADERLWPELPLSAWDDTRATLHMWTQIVGKIRLTLTPLQNHWWNSTLYVTARGLTTAAVPYRGDAFEIEFDFLEHRLVMRSAPGASRTVALVPQTVASFYTRVMATLGELGIAVAIDRKPQEVPDPIPFDQDEQHRSYDPEFARRFWRILLSVQMVLDEFRGRFLGKASPVHFFWGSFDLAYTRFSGRRAPERPGVITSEAYSHECSSVGWWPGDGRLPEPAFYAYTAPAPPGLGEQRIAPSGARYDGAMGEFLLPYSRVRTAPEPRELILAFAESAYEAGANLAHWNRRELERAPARLTDAA